MTGRTLRTVLGGALVAASVTVSLTGCSSGSVPPPTSVAMETTETTVFYATGRSVLAERKVVDATDIYRETLEEQLLAQPSSEANVAIVQPTAKVLSVTVNDRVATIDWDEKVLDFEATPDEKRLAQASILMLFGQFPEVETVRYTVEGKDSGTIGGKDIATFWGEVTLKNQPWKVVRIGDSGAAEKGSTDTSAAAKK